MPSTGMMLTQWLGKLLLALAMCLSIAVPVCPQFLASGIMPWKMRQIALILV